MNDNLSNLHLLIEKVNKDEILLPDFQRKFVWNDLENKQKKLVASVLAWLPIGSILLLEGNKKEFVAKKLGRKKTIESSDEDGLFLLDGQQRLTVLTNAFSNSIYNDLSDWNDISSDSLKFRFFLRFHLSNVEDFLSKIDNSPESLKEDVLGFYNFRFTFEHNVSEPQFLTDDIYSYIYTLNMDKDSFDHPFHPQFNLKRGGSKSMLYSACNRRIESNEYLIPLFLLIGNNFAYLKNIIKSLAKIQEELLIDIYRESDVEERKVRFGKLFPASTNHLNLPELFYNDDDEFVEFIDICSDEWVSNFYDYLNKSVTNLKLNIMQVNQSQRERAIDIYENLNQGGMSLNTFDLIIAKAAKNFRDGFYDAFIDSLKQEIKIPDFYDGNIHGNLLWNGFDNFDLFDEGNNQVVSKYINVFLNLLSLVSHIVENSERTRMREDLISIEFLKKDMILKISSEKIISNFKKVSLAINRALSFLKLNCGIRKLDDISYDHMLLGLSYFFYHDDVYNNKAKTKILDYWYWTSIFSGHYDSDQNTKIQNDLRLLSKILFKGKDSSLLFSRFDTVLDKVDFSDKATLLYEHVEHDILPKEVIKKTICQYILKKNPHDFIKETKLTSWDDGLNLEYHHIIPLNTQRSIKDSTRFLRSNKKELLNSPLNFTLILRESNNSIGGFTIDRYFQEIKPYVQNEHYLPNSEPLTQPESVKEWLDSRYIRLKSELMSYLKGLEQYFPKE